MQSSDDSINRSAIAARIATLTRSEEVRVLVVDDDDLELALIVDRLRSCGLRITGARDGQEAFELQQRERFPVVITDWHMPGVDGIEFTERVRAAGMDETYIIMLTASSSAFDYERGYLAGVDDYLTKQQPEAELLARLYAAVNVFALRRSLKEAQAALAAARDS